MIESLDPSSSGSGVGLMRGDESKGILMAMSVEEEIVMVVGSRRAFQRMRENPKGKRKRKVIGRRGKKGAMKENGKDNALNG